MEPACAAVVYTFAISAEYHAVMSHEFRSGDSPGTVHYGCFHDAFCFCKKPGGCHGDGYSSLFWNGIIAYIKRKRIVESHRVLISGEYL